jgi:hypothetical protein
MQRLTTPLIRHHLHHLAVPKRPTFGISHHLHPHPHAASQICHMCLIRRLHVWVVDFFEWTGTQMAVAVNVCVFKIDTADVKKKIDTAVVCEFFSA